MIGWIDLETTGLDRKASASGILECAVVITDDDLNELGAIEVVMHPVASAVNWINAMKPEVFQMHTRSGLLDDIANRGLRRHEAQAVLLNYLAPIIGEQRGKLPLAGSTISFDRAWMDEHLPEICNLFHYRSIDVTSISLCAERWAKKLREGRPRQSEASQHRAMPDIRYSIEVLRYYKNNGLFCACEDLK